MHSREFQREPVGNSGQWATFENFALLCGKMRPKIRARSCDAMNGLARKCHPLLSTSIPRSKPDISNTLSSGRSPVITLANSIPDICGIWKSDKRRWISPLKVRDCSRAFDPLSAVRMLYSLSSSNARTTATMRGSSSTTRIVLRSLPGTRSMRSLSVLGQRVAAAWERAARWRRTLSSVSHFGGFRPDFTPPVALRSLGFRAFLYPRYPKPPRGRTLRWYV